MSQRQSKRLEVMLPLRLEHGNQSYDRSSGASLFTGKTGLFLFCLFAGSVAMAQVQAVGAKLSVIDLLIKWTPLLAQGFVFNLAISFMAMAIGTVAGVLLGLCRISLLAPVRASSWIVVQFFRNAPWLVLLFFVMFLMPFEFRVGPYVIPFPDWIKSTLGLALPIMANIAEIVRGAVQSIPTAQWDAARSTEGAYSALLKFESGAFANLTYNGYGHFDSDVWMDHVGEIGNAKPASESEKRYGSARKRLATTSTSDQESQLKAARNYGGSLYQATAQNEDAHQHFGPVVVSCEKRRVAAIPVSGAEMPRR
jgi:His/Glu/Gln/Arg/opine family amino acid ABC transporter permease subunit